jgi:hypothetical protein
MKSKTLCRLMMHYQVLVVYDSYHKQMVHLGVAILFKWARLYLFVLILEKLAV